jgi:hypothetical protein
VIQGDEGRPMSLMEFISDEPREPEPFVEYLLTNARARFDYWQAMPNDRDPEKPTARECVLSQLQFQIFELEDVLMKMRRKDREAR